MLLCFACGQWYQISTIRSTAGLALLKLINSGWEAERSQPGLPGTSCAAAAVQAAGGQSQTYLND